MYRPHLSEMAAAQAMASDVRISNPGHDGKEQMRILRPKGTGAVPHGDDIPLGPEDTRTPDPVSTVTIAAAGQGPAPVTRASPGTLLPTTSSSPLNEYGLSSYPLPSPIVRMGPPAHGSTGSSGQAAASATSDGKRVQESPPRAAKVLSARECLYDVALIAPWPLVICTVFGGLAAEMGWFPQWLPLTNELAPVHWSFLACLMLVALVTVDLATWFSILAVGVATLKIPIYLHMVRTVSAMFALGLHDPLTVQYLAELQRSMEKPVLWLPSTLLCCLLFLDGLRRQAKAPRYVVALDFEFTGPCPVKHQVTQTGLVLIDCLHREILERYEGPLLNIDRSRKPAEAPPWSKADIADGWDAETRKWWEKHLPKERDIIDKGQGQPYLDGAKQFSDTIDQWCKQFGPGLRLLSDTVAADPPHLAVLRADIGASAPTKLHGPMTYTPMLFLNVQLAAASAHPVGWILHRLCKQFRRLCRRQGIRPHNAVSDAETIAQRYLDARCIYCV